MAQATRRDDTLFRFLRIGQSFDWIDDSRHSFNSFFLRCTKVSQRCYVDSTGQRHQVGSLNATVFHTEA